MPTIYIDDRPHEVREGQNLLEACLELGFDLPYFCWHPILGSVGSCRQCAIKQYADADDDQGSIAMACMTAAEDGTRLSIDDPEAAKFRATIIEWLMSNHPHDCPVCEEGGECHLQDMTVMTGHSYRRYRFKKRTHRNQNLGPFIGHEMNRCIACYRCVRFYREYAHGTDLEAMGPHNHVYFGRREDGPLENEFSGNLVEICPTGVFTDKPFGETYTRKWDLRTTPSVCLHCSVGCNTSPGARYGHLKRVQNRYHGDINRYFLCDRGRFGHGFVEHDERIRTPFERSSGGAGSAQARTADEAIDTLRVWLAESHGSVVGIGSPRASLETNFALRELVGADHFSTGMSAHDQRLVRCMRDILTDGPARAPTLVEMGGADAVVVLGEDITNTAPRIALSLHQAARTRAEAWVSQFDVPRWKDAGVRNSMQWAWTPFHILTPTATRLDNVATNTWHGAPADIARIAHAVVHALDPSAPAVEALTDECIEEVRLIVQTLRQADRPLVVSGFGAHSEAVVEAAGQLARALCTDARPADLCFTQPEANSLGLGLIDGDSAEDALQRVIDGDADTLVIAENDLYRRAPPAQVDAALAAARHVVALDCLDNATTRRAGLVIPAGTFAEASGTVVNYEGRAQRFFRVFEPDDEIRAGWAWLDAVGGGARRSLDELTEACAAAIPALSEITDAAPSAEYRIRGQRVARGTPRCSGRTAKDAVANVSEPVPPRDVEAPLSYTMEGHHPDRETPASLLPYVRAPGWNSIQAVKKFQQEINGPIVGGDAGVRLLELAQAKPRDWLRDLPDAFAPADDSWLIVPLHHIFGSDELSAASPPLAERIPAGYAALNTDEAGERGLAEGSELVLLLNGDECRLPVRHDAELARGLVGIPVGLPGVTPAALPERVDIPEQAR